jgi:hypothetical protein
VSILHKRITGQDYLTTPDMHPFGTAGTPMVMPMTFHAYTGDTILYGTVQPLVTADGAVVPGMADVTYPATPAAGSASMPASGAHYAGLAADGAVVPAGRP